MKPLALIAICIIMLLSVSCAHDYTRPEGESVVFRPVSPSEAFDLINKKEGLLIVDTRTGWERSSGWIAHSVHISYFDFLLGGGYNRVDRSLPVLIVCAHGVRSYRVGRSMIKRGWKEIYDLEGGMKAWVKNGFPVEGGNQ